MSNVTQSICWIAIDFLRQKHSGSWISNQNNDQIATDYASRWPNGSHFTWLDKTVTIILKFVNYASHILLDFNQITSPSSSEQTLPYEIIYH